MSKGMVKYSMRISDWPFQTISNNLQVELISDINSNNGNECKSDTSSVDKSNSLRSIKLVLNGVTLYPYFLYFLLLIFIIYI